MKSRALFLVLVSLGCSGYSAPFQDLGFEEYNTTNSFLPGWQLLNSFVKGSNTIDGTFIGLNVVTAGLNYGTIYDTNIYQRGYFYPIEGKYALGLWPGPDFATLQFSPYSLVQTGDVPSNAKSIHFVNFGGPFELRINNSPVSLSYAYPPGHLQGSRSDSIDAYGDVSLFAGQTVQLKFTTIKDIAQLNGIDSISFSSVPVVPEPDLIALLSLGAFWFWRLRRSGDR